MQRRFRDGGRLACVRAIVLGFMLIGGLGATASAQPAPRLLDGGVRRADLLWVQFAEGTGARLRGGVPSDLGGGAMAGIRPMLQELSTKGFEWSRGLPGITEEKVDQLRRNAEARAGKPAPDQNLLFLLRVPAGEDGARWIQRLAARPEVAWVDGVELPAPAPGAPDFTPNQGYATSAPNGIGAWLVSGLPGGTGSGVSLIDVEYSWNLAHLDLPPGISIVGPAPVDPFNDPHHGTAVLGQVVSRDNGFGTRGLAPDVNASVVAANTSSGYNVAAAINLATLALTAGDVILIEQQTFGPRYTGVPEGTQFGLIPVEWNLPTYNAIRTAVLNGIVVVEAAGNGEQNLDDVVYQTGHAGHWPFLPENDSGAIMVGAGGPSGPQLRQRVWFSNYGQTVDLQGWGLSVTTTGYGDAYALEGANLLYTHSFGGTSGASPIVASAVCLLQAIAKLEVGGPLTPAQVRQFLVETATPQAGNTSQNIGPLPDVPAAVFAALNTPIDAPGAFALTSPVDGAISVPRPVLLTWGNAEGVATYRLVLDDDADLSSPILDADGVVGTGYFVPNNLTSPLTNYYWMVEARNIGGVTVCSPAMASFQTVGIPPGSFALTSPADGANVSTTTPLLQWQSSAGASSYSITVSTRADLLMPVFTVSGLPSTSVSVPAGLLINGTRYYWQVRATNITGTTNSSPTVASFGVIVPSCQGDANGDLQINFVDISTVLANWGSAGRRATRTTMER